MHENRAIALLVVVAFASALFTPCWRLISASVHGVYEVSGESARNSSPGSLDSATGSDTRPLSNQVVLKARCPCGCDERPAIAGSSAALGVALITRAPSLSPLPGHSKAGSPSSALPSEPPRKVDTIPRSI